MDSDLSLPVVDATPNFNPYNWDEQLPQWAYAFRTPSRRVLFVRNFGDGIESVVQLVKDMDSHEVLIRKVHKVRLREHPKLTSGEKELELPDEILVLNHLNELRKAQPHGWEPLHLSECLEHEYISCQDAKDKLRYYSVSYWKLYNGGDVGRAFLPGKRGDIQRPPLPIVAVARMMRHVLNALQFMWHASDTIYHGDVHMYNIFFHWKSEKRLPDFYLGDFSRSRQRLFPDWTPGIDVELTPSFELHRLAEVLKGFLHSVVPDWEDRIDSVTRDGCKGKDGLACRLILLYKSMRKLITDSQGRLPNLRGLCVDAFELETLCLMADYEPNELNSDAYKHFTTVTKAKVLSTSDVQPYTVHGDINAALDPRDIWAPAVEGKGHPPLNIHGPWELIKLSWTRGEPKYKGHSRPNPVRLTGWKHGGTESMEKIPHPPFHCQFYYLPVRTKGRRVVGGEGAIKLHLGPGRSIFSDDESDKDSSNPSTPDRGRSRNRRRPSSSSSHGSWAVSLSPDSHDRYLRENILEVQPICWRIREAIQAEVNTKLPPIGFPYWHPSSEKAYSWTMPLRPWERGRSPPPSRQDVAAAPIDSADDDPAWAAYDAQVSSWINNYRDYTTQRGDMRRRIEALKAGPDASKASKDLSRWYYPEERPFQPLPSENPPSELPPAYPTTRVDRQVYDIFDDDFETEEICRGDDDSGKVITDAKVIAALAPYFKQVHPSTATLVRKVMPNPIDQVQYAVNDLIETRIAWKVRSGTLRAIHDWVHRFKRSKEEGEEDENDRGDGKYGHTSFPSEPKKQQDKEKEKEKESNNEGSSTTPSPPSSPDAPKAAKTAQKPNPGTTAVPHSSDDETDEEEKQRRKKRAAATAAAAARSKTCYCWETSDAWLDELVDIMADAEAAAGLGARRFEVRYSKMGPETEAEAKAGRVVAHAGRGGFTGL